jgi:hypothetical protein
MLLPLVCMVGEIVSTFRGTAIRYVELGKNETLPEARNSPVCGTIFVRYRRSN